MDDFEVIADQTLTGRRADGEDFPIQIEIGRPFRWGGTSPTEWACWVKSIPFRSKPFAVHGEGSLQALCLALQSVQYDLINFRDEGGQLLWGEDDFPFKSFWRGNEPLSFD